MADAEAAPPAQSASAALDEARQPASRRVALPRTLTPVRALVCAQAERLLVAGSFAAAAAAAQGVLSRASGGAAAEDAEDEGEDLSYAAAAVLLQARRCAGDSPAALRALLETTFGSLRAVPPDALVLWCAAEQSAKPSLALSLVLARVCVRMRAAACTLA
jgi:hypothetical protein